MNNPDQTKWDQIYRQTPANKPQAAQVLLDFVHLLPMQGQALDLACGRGGNALLLAQRGLATQAWDLSAAALAHISSEPGGPQIQTRVFDAEQDPLPEQQFDVICISHFLHRPLFASLRQAVKPGGLIYYQTFIQDKAQAVGPKREDFLLKTNELLHAFNGFIIRAYREEGCIGKPELGFRNQAMIVAQRPNPLMTSDLS